MNPDPPESMVVVGWALNAAAVLLVLYGVRVLLQGRDPEHPGRQARLGCGFFVLAALLWSLAWHEWLGGVANAARLGLGIVLVAPAIGALSRPHGARLLVGIVGLVLGVVVAGPVAREVWVTHVEEAGRAKRTALEERVAELEAARHELSASITAWQVEREQVHGAIAAGGHADFAALSADPEALERLERLATLDDVLARAAERMRAWDADLQAANAELARLAGGGTDDALGRTGIEEIEPVEIHEDAYGHGKELEALFEREFGG